jgi:hypothetical protein
MYQDRRGKLSSGIFAALVYGANLRDGAGDTAATTTRDGNKGNERTPTHLLKRPFEVFDMEGKGYVNEADLERVMTKVTGRSVTASGDERRPRRRGVGIVGFRAFFLEAQSRALQAW